LSEKGGKGRSGGSIRPRAAFALKLNQADPNPEARMAINHFFFVFIKSEKG